MSTAAAEPSAPAPSGVVWLDAEEQRAWRAYLRMQGELAAHLNRQLQADSDLSHADFAVLVQLSEAEGGRLRGGALGRAMQWEKSRVSHQLSRMEKRGLVAREECATDRRGAFVVLTPAGRAAVEAAAPGHVTEVRRLLFDGLSPEQLAVFREVAEQVVERLDAACGSSPCGAVDPGCGAVEPDC